MIVETRKTASGTEYWDAKEKKVLFVPKGQKPNFEMTENPKSMIYGMDLAKGKDKTLINDEFVDTTPYGVNDGETSYQLNEMTIKELRSLAEQQEIKIPKDVTKRDDMAQCIFENWSTDDEE
ncbi:hypothetical protein ABE28_009215 [Peribacillus muralis]|uniref:Rho termination factor N-terminal domain-containing protein n=1 Tax=Peribacillus muralis TaxID=264697 RepID=A0A1B3XMW5_9BACI|nr:hypothetical protein [Peribacillus muralis]AOH54530.1 hypothetical protein ABE28_009215 [Peribacillus muralis]